VIVTAENMCRFQYLGNLATVVALVLCAAGCEQEAKAPKVGPANIELTRTSIPASVVTVGFGKGRLRQDTRLEGFEISKVPVVLDEFNSCISAGACSAASLVGVGEVPEEVDTGQEAALVSQPEAGAAFCAWVGAKLPTLEQWLLAGRGPSVQRFSWGDQLGGCEQHAGAMNVHVEPGASPGDRVRSVRLGSPCANTATRTLQVGVHPLGASRFGVEDVLMASSELLRKNEENLFPACRGAEGECSVYGISPGAIDFVRSADVAERGDQESVKVSSAQYAFRCVWKGEG
jgi:formylglycine-generating enzyme required for sulfatase activity